jgi:hypothetical protein
MLARNEDEGGSRGEGGDREAAAAGLRGITAPARESRRAADIVLLVDATGSMLPFLGQLRDRFDALVRLLTTPREVHEVASVPCPAGLSIPAPPMRRLVKDWRCRVVGYRDAVVNKDWLVDNPFVRDLGHLGAQLARLRVDGGGDEAESLLDALYRVATTAETGRGQAEVDSRWRYGHQTQRVIAVFTDGPFHETMVIPEARGGTMADVQHAITSNRIRVYVVAPRAHCFDQLSMMDKCEYEPLVDEEGHDVTLETYFGAPGSLERCFEMIHDMAFVPIRRS